MLLSAVGNTAAVEPCVKVRLTNCYARTVTVAHGPVTLCAEARVTPDEQHHYLALEMAYAEPSVIPELGMATPELGMADALPDLADPESQDGPVPASLIQLDGANERIRHDRKFADLYGGSYLLTATVYADEARRKVCGRAIARVTIH